jgi:hypothetical protein
MEAIASQRHDLGPITRHVTERVARVDDERRLIEQPSPVQRAMCVTMTTMAYPAKL